MDELEFTKIAGAVLAALLLIFGPKAIIEMNVGKKSEKPGYVLEAPAPEGEDKKEAAADKPSAPAADAKKTDATAKAEPAAQPEKGAAAPAKAAGEAAGGDAIVPLLAKADPANGKAIFKKCQACHVAEKGKTPTVGPNLWGVVNRPKASYPGFSYSEAMKSKGGDWSFAELGHFLHSPKTYVPGTKMVFNGLPTPEDEADVISYLATLADTPVPLPK